MTAVVKLKLKLLGSPTVAEAAHAIVIAADHLGMPCCVEVRGYELTARPGDVPEDLIVAYNRLLLAPATR